MEATDTNGKGVILTKWSVHLPGGDSVFGGAAVLGCGVAVL